MFCMFPKSSFTPPHSFIYKFEVPDLENDMQIPLLHPSKVGKKILSQKISNVLKCMNSTLYSIFLPFKKILVMIFVWILRTWFRNLNQWQWYPINSWGIQSQSVLGLGAELLKHIFLTNFGAKNLFVQFSLWLDQNVFQKILRQKKFLKKILQFFY